MARRKAHRRNKHTSGMMRMKFQIPTASNPVVGSTTEFIDLAQSLSQSSRRFYRQGYCYRVVGVEIVSAANAGTGFVTVSTVPTTWVASGAWQKSFAAFNKMNDQVLENEPSIKPRFHDFKHYLDEDHVLKQSAPGESDGNLLPLEAFFTGQSAEWDYSKIQIPNDAAVGNTVTHVLHMVGPEVGAPTQSLPMIQGYADSRAVPQSPDPALNQPQNSWMNQLFDDGDNFQEITAVLSDDNDELPYDQDGYIGGATIAPYAQIMGEGLISATTVGGETWINGGMAYSGLLRIDNDLTGDQADSVVDVIVYLAPGDYKGIDAIPMQDVN